MNIFREISVRLGEMLKEDENGYGAIIVCAVVTFLLLLILLHCSRPVVVMTRQS